MGGGWGRGLNSRFQSNLLFNLGMVSVDGEGAEHALPVQPTAQPGYHECGCVQGGFPFHYIYGACKKLLVSVVVCVRRRACTSASSPACSSTWAS